MAKTLFGSQLKDIANNKKIFKGKVHSVNLGEKSCEIKLTGTGTIVPVFFIVNSGSSNVIYVPSMGANCTIDTEHGDLSTAVLRTCDSFDALFLNLENIEMSADVLKLTGKNGISISGSKIQLVGLEDIRLGAKNFSLLSEEYVKIAVGNNDSGIKAELVINNDGGIVVKKATSIKLADDDNAALKSDEVLKYLKTLTELLKDLKVIGAATVDPSLAPQCQKLLLELEQDNLSSNYLTGGFGDAS